MSSMMCGMLLGAGVNAKRTYIDDVFSTYVYAGNSTTRSINNGIDLSGEGGLVWIKRRDGSDSYALFDTTRGATKGISSDTTSTESTDTDSLTSFNNNGFSLGTGYTNFATNLNNTDYASWTFRKSPMFDVVTYTGNGSNRTISHSLGSIPGMIIIKRTDTTSNWSVYHRDFNGGVNPEHYVAFLDSTDGKASHATSWNNSPPTSSVFHVGTHARVNGDGGTFVAYLFAGGKSTSNNAVSFDGTDDRLTLADSSDFTFGTGDFTVEGWFNKSDAAATGFFQISDTTGGLKASTTDSLELGYSSFNSSITLVYNDTYHHQSYSYTPDKYCHFAVCRKGSTIKVFIDGVELISKSDSKDYDFGNLCIGGRWDTSNLMKGKIANFRIVKGQALYTQGFTPTTEVFTTSSRDVESSKVKLICCNGSTTTAATVTPGTITAVGNPTVASSESIFDDTAANRFGESGKESIIKCGSYIGNGSSTGPEINLGFEPQFILHKSSTVSGTAWHVFDCMRGVVTGGNDAILVPNTSAAEASDSIIDITSTGFKITTSAGGLNQNNGRYVYMAIRRPDGYVGKPPELGTGVFAIDTGSGSSTIPTFDSNFVVDYALRKEPATTAEWASISRLTGEKYLVPNGTAAQGNYGYFKWDSNVGFGTNFGSGVQAWMFKRHAGFDVVTYDSKSQAENTKIAHSMSVAPEMIWIKYRNNTNKWIVGHKGLNGGTNAWTYNLVLNTNDEEEILSSTYTTFSSTAPTSTHFTVGSNWDVNAGSGASYIAMLFASVEGISKVGYYTGNGTSDSSTQTITTGFQPRFILIKSSSNDEHWVIFDTTRGWSSGSADKVIELNNTDAQFNFPDIGHPISTGFVIKEDASVMNLNNHKYIYYAHA